jgi:hypothetical protein
MEYLDPWTSRAFAVADHQAAHVYVADPADVPRVRDIVAARRPGPISIEWEDAGMDRLTGAPDALAYVRRLTEIEPPSASFDAAFGSGD